jgi:hypothetical protein
MIGYAPFLGQVRLVRPIGLGQEILAEEDLARAVGDRNRRISSYRIAINATTMRPDVRQAFFEKLNSCGAMLSKAITREDLDRVDRCLDEVDEALKSPLLPMLSTREEVERQASKVQKSGIPTWAYVMGGLAAAGVVAYFVFKR